MSLAVHTLIVGGTRGIGLATARSFLDRKHSVSILARNKPEEDSLPPGASFYACDIRDHDLTERSLSKSAERFGGLTNLVFAQRLRGWDRSVSRELELSLEATERFLNSALLHFSATGGSIILLSSPARHQIAEEQALGYHIAKSAVEQLVKYYAVRLGPRGIRVNAIAPSLVAKQTGETLWKDTLAEASPLQRIGTITEIAETITWLCDPRASLITGQTLDADAGLSLVAPASLVRSVCHSPTGRDSQ